MELDFNKGNGLVPVIIQHNYTMQVLMLGYMNKTAFLKSKEEQRVTFYSRSKKRLWTKGETSGNFIDIVSMQLDCDNDAILIKGIPNGPTCHTGSTSCFNDNSKQGFIYQLEQIIAQRIDQNDSDSYTNQLYQKGINKVAQKLGEEAIELVIEAKDNNDDLFKNEAADLFYHYLVLLKSKGIQLEEVEQILMERSKK